VGYIGGAERVMLTLLSGLALRGFVPILTCPGDGGLAKAAVGKGINVISLPLSRLRATSNLAQLTKYPGAIKTGREEIRNICREHKVDLMHAHHPVGALYCSRAVHEMKIPLVMHLHDGLPVAMYYKLLLRLTARMASRIVCVSNVAREAACQSGVKQAIEIVSNGLDRLFLEENQHAPPCGVKGPGPHVGVFAALEPRKGQDIFLRAAMKIAQEFPSAQFWLVGPKGLSGREAFEDGLRRLARNRILNGRVHFVGNRADVVRWMKAMSLIVLPSISHETVGMVLLEAMALKVPVVGSRLGGVNDVIRDGETGRLVAPGDPDDLADAMRDILSNGGAALAARAACEVRARYSPELFCDRIAELYSDVLRVGENHRMLQIS
jgi:glycosyltransferase involved in cell wall biosynthesis